MQEQLNKVLGINHLPIFPLPAVLMPLETMPLHIFENRYRKMIKDIALEKNMFGISYFEPDETMSEKPEIGSVGCVAEIKAVDNLPDGRSNILTIGIIRYRIKNYVETGKPYHVCEVEFFEDFEETEPERLQSLSDEVFDLFVRITKTVVNFGIEETNLYEITRQSPEYLSFLVFSIFNFRTDLESKYKFLETRSTLQRLEKVSEMLKKSVRRVEENAEINKRAQSNGFNKKKIKL